MPPGKHVGKPVGLLVDLKDARAFTVASTSESSSSGHPVDRNGKYKKRKIDSAATAHVKPGTSFTLAQLKQWEMAKKKKPAPAKRVAHKTAPVWVTQGRVVVKYIRAPQRPPTKVKEWLLHGFEKEWKEEQEAAWAETPLPLRSWGIIEEWSRAVCDALELWC